MRNMVNVKFRKNSNSRIHNYHVLMNEFRRFLGHVVNKKNVALYKPISFVSDLYCMYLYTCICQIV